MASLRIGIRIRLTRNPGVSAHGTASLPRPDGERQRGVERGRVDDLRAHDLDQLHQRRRVEEVQADDAVRAGPTPTRPPTPTARWCWWRGSSRGRRCRSARRTAPASARAPRRSPRSRCRRRDSAVRSVVAVRRPRAASASAADMMPFSTRLASPASIFATPASTNRCSTSRATTTWPASRHTWAMPAPIVPSPTTPTVPIDTRLPPLASAVIVLAARGRKSAMRGIHWLHGSLSRPVAHGLTRPQRRGRDRRRTGHRDHRARCGRGDRRSRRAGRPRRRRALPGRHAPRAAARSARSWWPSTSARSSDLGGLVVEMARRGVHNHALVERRAADVVELERRIAELDGRIDRRGRGAPRPRRRAAADGADRGARRAGRLAMRDVPRAARQRRQLLRLLRRAAGAPVTDDEAFEEPVEQPRCPDCLAAVEPDQQYCLQCGERLAPAGPPPSSPLGGRTRPPAAALVAGGALLLLPAASASPTASRATTRRRRPARRVKPARRRAASLVPTTLSPTQPARCRPSRR